MVLAAFVLLAVVWEIYRRYGPEDGGSLAGLPILPRSNDTVMPPIGDMVSRLGEPELRGSDRDIWQVVLSGVWYSLRLAAVGLALGATVGLALAVVMARFKFVERGVLPWLVISQTVPLIALAPLVASWGGRVHIGSWEWPRWLSASVLSAFLAFFPIAVGALKGLTSPAPSSLELMDSLAASWRQTLVKVRFPAAVPHLVPALRLAASAAVVGVVVAEISIGLQGGIGRITFEYARQATSDPAKVYTGVMGVALLGLTMAGFVVTLDTVLMRNRPKEARS